MNEVADVLEPTMQPPGRAAILHDDLKLDTCQFDPAEPDSVHSVLDWDMATLRDPLVDVVWRRSQLLAAADRSADGGIPIKADADDVAVLLFTSGTSGEPKAAVLRHRQLVAYIIGSVEFLAADPGEATLVSVPPYHVAGISAILSSVYAGRRIVQLEAFDAESWVRLANDERVTHAMVVPTMLTRIVDYLVASGERIPSLRHLSYGGGQMPARTIETALGLLPHVDFVNAYGLTETSSTIAPLDPAGSPHVRVQRRRG